MSAVTDDQDALTGLRVAVLGPGGVGGLLAALFARAGATVTCLGGPGTAEHLRTTGLRVESGQFGDSTTPVDATEQLTAPVDVLFVTVEATQLHGALDRAPADVLGDALAVPLLNGVEHVDLLRRRHPGAGAVPAPIRVESTRPTGGPPSRSSVNSTRCRPGPSWSRCTGTPSTTSSPGMTSKPRPRWKRSEVVFPGLVR